MAGMASSPGAPQGPVAHTLPPPAREADWEPLEQHLQDVAEEAAKFARRIRAGEWGQLAGLWHDVGKYNPAFQDYLRRSAAALDDDPHRAELCDGAPARGKVQHAVTGACYAARLPLPAGRLLAYCIAGHHAGLPNTETDPGLGETEVAALEHKLKQPPVDVDAVMGHVPEHLLKWSAPPWPDLCLDRSDPRRASFQIGFFVRMVFSCLVDADYLCTERFMQPGRVALRPARPVSMGELADRVDGFLDGLGCTADDSIVNRCRQDVLGACRDAASQPPGLYSLTVPTGGGKTLSSLAFALRHAHAHSLDRVIVAIPFTSIIEQNAAVYRDALGELAHQVLEHHSNLDRGGDTEGERERLAAENWDAPLVVTTNVQLFESLFAARPGRCRKLHRIARSVIVLDEAQALPPNLLAPTLWALRELVENYGCTVVLCTATQPALEQREGFQIGLHEPREIVPPAQLQTLFDSLKRVHVERAGVVDDAALIERLAREPQALCILNTRGHAAEVFDSLTQQLGETQSTRRHGVDQPRVGSCLHLSANMCPRHRSAVLRLIRRRLKKGEPCRVVSTQLIEAGVDVDFPVVYRAMAGLDAIAQAAGRCNREGGRPEPGRVIVFEPDTSERRLPPFVRAAADHARQVAEDHDDLLSPAAQHDYFRLHYWDEGSRTGGWDRPPGAGAGAEGVLDCFGRQGMYLQFRTATDRYRLIEDSQTPVLIPYGPRGRALIERLQVMNETPGREFDRKLQRWAVAVHKPVLDRMLDARAILPPDQGGGRWVLGNEAGYDRRVGLRAEAATGLDADLLIR